MLAEDGIICKSPVIYQLDAHKRAVCAFGTIAASTSNDAHKVFEAIAPACFWIDIGWEIEDVPKQMELRSEVEDPLAILNCLFGQPWVVHEERVS